MWPSKWRADPVCPNFTSLALAGSVLVVVLVTVLAGSVLVVVLVTVLAGSVLVVVIVL